MKYHKTRRGIRKKQRQRAGKMNEMYSLKKEYMICKKALFLERRDWRDKERSMTNLERLQDMNEEEMANFLLGNADEPCSYCPPRTVCKTGPCQTCWEHWLRREHDEREG